MMKNNLINKYEQLAQMKDAFAKEKQTIKQQQDGQIAELEAKEAADKKEKHRADKSAAYEKEQADKKAAAEAKKAEIKAAADAKKAARACGSVSRTGWPRTERSVSN